MMISAILDEDTLKDAVRNDYKNAFKLLIKQKKKNAVNVGIFDDQNQDLDDTEIKSSEGVSCRLHVGQVLYLYD